jgi:hypothetical protein
MKKIAVLLTIVMIANSCKEEKKEDVSNEGSTSLIPPDTIHRFIKISTQCEENRICQKQISL